MILRYELPKEAEQVISLTDNERIYYAVPVDIDDAGNFLEDSFFIVTNRRLFVVEKDSIKQEYDVSKCIDVKAEAKIGGGLLVINFDGVPKHIVHYSARHLSRYAYIARGIHILASGREEEVVSTEYEKICPKCHHAIPGTKYCPHCSKEGGFWKGFLKMAAPYKRKFAGIIVLMILAARCDTLESGNTKAFGGRCFETQRGWNFNRFYLPWHHVFVKCRNCCD